MLRKDSTGRKPSLVNFWLTSPLTPDFHRSVKNLFNDAHFFCARTLTNFSSKCQQNDTSCCWIVQSTFFAKLNFCLFFTKIHASFKKQKRLDVSIFWQNELFNWKHIWHLCSSVVFCQKPISFSEIRRTVKVLQTNFPN